MIAEHLPYAYGMRVQPTAADAAAHSHGFEPAITMHMVAHFMQLAWEHTVAHGTA